VIKLNAIITAVAYGLFVWCVMNLVVVPSTQIGSRPVELTNALINIAILIVCIGLPLSLIARAYYSKVQLQRKAFR
jgi:hypothetical protein